MVKGQHFKYTRVFLRRGKNLVPIHPLTHYSFQVKGIEWDNWINSLYPPLIPRSEALSSDHSEDNLYGEDKRKTESGTRPWH